MLANPGNSPRCSSGYLHSGRVFPLRRDLARNMSWKRKTTQWTDHDPLDRLQPTLRSRLASARRQPRRTHRACTLHPKAIHPDRCIPAHDIGQAVRLGRAPLAVRDLSGEFHCGSGCEVSGLGVDGLGCRGQGLTRSSACRSPGACTRCQPCGQQDPAKEVKLSD